MWFSAYFSRCVVGYNVRIHLHVITSIPFTIPRENFVAFENELRLRNNLSSSSLGKRLFKIPPLACLYFGVPPHTQNDKDCGIKKIFPEMIKFVKKKVTKTSKRVSSSRIMQQESESGHMTVWNPSDILHSEHCNYAVLVLNRPILWKPQQMLRVWEKAQVTVTVDGGTNRWLKYLEDIGIDILSDQYKKYIPDLITGDMDSSSETMVEELKSMGSIVIETPDQNHTDFTKALIQVKEYAGLKSINLEKIYVFAETTGRFDHIIGNIHTLYKSKNLVGNTKVIQVASNSLTWVLRHGLHKINIPKKLVQQKSWCGLMPLGFPVKCISTTGLKWNLNNACLMFDGLISTSNTYDNCEVTVNTDTPVTWSMVWTRGRWTLPHGSS